MVKAIKDYLENTPGASKSWLADELDMSRPTLYARLEDGRWTLDEAIRLAEIIGCKLDDLVVREDA